MKIERGILTTLIVSWLATIASAQTPPYQPPRVSPWLDINRRGAGPAQNYYRMTRPAFQAQSAFENLQQFDAYTQAALDNQQNQQQQASQTVTGHSATFMNYSHFYPGASGGGRSGGPTGAPRRR